MLISQVAHWFIFAAGLVLVVASAAILFLSIRKSGLRWIWVTALAGSGLAWPLVVMARLGIPFEQTLIPWQQVSAEFDPTAQIISSSPTILLDSISWSFAFALSTLLFSVLLTVVSRVTGLNWRAWIGSFSLAILGLISILSGNPLTFIITLTALDLAELLILLISVDEDRYKQNIVIRFYIRISGLVVILVAALLAARNGAMLNFDTIPIELNALLVIAILIRLGVVPFHLPFQVDSPMRQGLFTMLHLAPYAANMAFLSRLAVVGVADNLRLIFILLFLGVATYSIFSWIMSKDEYEGWLFWLLVGSTMAAIAGILGQPEACLAWGVTGVLTGGFIYLRSIRHRFLIPLTVWAGFGLSTLPFSPLWLNASIFRSVWASFPWWSAIVIIGVLTLLNAFLIFGFLRHLLNIPEEQAEPEQWIWLIYLPGLSLLLLANFSWGWINRPAFENLTLFDWSAGPVIGLLTSAIWIWHQRNPGLFSVQDLAVKYSNRFQSNFFSLRWFGLGFNRMYQFGNNLNRLVNGVLEGDGGVLWAILLLVILFSLVAQFR